MKYKKNNHFHQKKKKRKGKFQWDEKKNKNLKKKIERDEINLEGSVKFTTSTKIKTIVLLNLYSGFLFTSNGQFEI